MTPNVSQENEITPHEKTGSVLQPEIDVDALTEENSELFVLLQNERRKSKRLEYELKLRNPPENLTKKCISSDVVAGNDKVAEDFLQNVVLMLKKRLESKQKECDDLQDKLSVLNQEFSSQREQLAGVTLEFEHQIKHLNEMLAQERNLNTLLSEESDQNVHELQTKIHEKDNLNTELKFIQEEMSERMQTIEDECRFYQTKLHDTEQRLSNIVNAKDQRVAMEMETVSCQVSESELYACELYESEGFYKEFLALWGSGDFGMDALKNSKKYKMDVFKLIRDGFSELRENPFAKIF